MMIMIMAMIIMRKIMRGVLISFSWKYTPGIGVKDGALTWRITPTKVDL